MSQSAPAAEPKQATAPGASAAAADVAPSSDLFKGSSSSAAAKDHFQQKSAFAAETTPPPPQEKLAADFKRANSLYFYIIDPVKRAHAIAIWHRLAYHKYQPAIETLQKHVKEIKYFEHADACMSKAHYLHLQRKTADAINLLTKEAFALAHQLHQSLSIPNPDQKDSTEKNRRALTRMLNKLSEIDDNIKNKLIYLAVRNVVALAALDQKLEVATVLIPQKIMFANLRYKDERSMATFIDGTLFSKEFLKVWYNPKLSKSPILLELLGEASKPSTDYEFNPFFTVWKTAKLWANSATSALIETSLDSIGFFRDKVRDQSQRTSVQKGGSSAGVSVEAAEATYAGRGPTLSSAAASAAAASSSSSSSSRAGSAALENKRRKSMANSLFHMGFLDIRTPNSQGPASAHPVTSSSSSSLELKVSKY